MFGFGCGVGKGELGAPHLVTEGAHALISISIFRMGYLSTGGGMGMDEQVVFIPRGFGGEMFFLLLGTRSCWWSEIYTRGLRYTQQAASVLLGFFLVFVLVYFMRLF